MDETIEVNLLKDKKISDSKNLPWPQKYEDFIKDIKEKFKLKKNSNIILTLITIDEDDWDIGSQDDLDPYLEEDKIKKFNIEITENEEPEPEPDLSNPSLNPEPQLDILEINIDEIIKEVFNNDAYKKELEINNKKLSDNFKSNLELSINSIIEEKQKDLVNDIDSKLKIFVDDFSNKKNEVKNFALELNNEINDIKNNVEQMSLDILEAKNTIKPIQIPQQVPIPKPNNIQEIKPIKAIKFEKKNIEKIIEIKEAKFININNINIINAGNVSCKSLCFVKDQEKSSNELCFFGNSRVTNEHQITMPGELEPKDSLNCALSMSINNAQPGKEYKMVINAKENDDIISESFEIIIKINKKEEDPMEQIRIQANGIFEEIKNQFIKHENLINKNDIINKLINNNLNKDEIINEIKNKINEIELNETKVKAEQIYNELDLSNVNIDKNEAIEIIKKKNFNKEEIQEWIDEKIQNQNKEKAQNIYNNLRNEQNLDFSKCTNEEEILKKIIELKFNEGDLRIFFEKKKDDPNEKLVKQIFDQLEEDYQITTIVEEEAAKDKIREIIRDNNADVEVCQKKAEEWVDELITSGVN